MSNTADLKNVFWEIYQKLEMYFNGMLLAKNLPTKDNIIIV